MRTRYVATIAAVLTAALGATNAVPAAASADTNDSVVVGFVLEPTNLDIIHQAGAALDQVLLDNVYETIVESDRSGQISPGLATLEISEDGLTYTLALQDGVMFHDGQPLTASDVVWSVLQQRDEGIGSSQANLARIDAIEPVDDHTVVLTLSEPDNDLAFHLSGRAGAVLKEGANGLENSANGTGPFTLEEWNVGSTITLARNDDYRGEAPRVAAVVYQYFPDPNAAVNALVDGDADLITGVDSELVGQFEDDPDFTIISGPTNGEFTLGFNNQDEVLSDPLVRQAITHAIDKQGMIALFDGYGSVIAAPVPPFEPWYEDLTDLYPYDPELARELLEEAGYGDGLDLSFIVPNHYPPRGPDYVVSQLADVGITLDLQAVEFPTWIEQVFINHDYDVTVVLHVEPRDIDNYGNPEYYWLYDNPEVQQLLADARTSPDPDEAVELRRQAARQIAEDAPVVWLMLNDDLIVARNGVSGIPEFDVNSRFDASNLEVIG